MSFSPRVIFGTSIVSLLLVSGLATAARADQETLCGPGTATGQAVCPVVDQVWFETISPQAHQTADAAEAGLLGHSQTEADYNLFRMIMELVEMGLISGDEAVDWINNPCC